MKKIIPIILILGILLIILPSVKASFACGYVEDTTDFSASWLNVLVHYTENINDSTTCQINPENKFCCDLDEIKSVNWQVGKEINAQVIDTDSGYIADPVKTTISGQGYDIFPTMAIQKAITINSNLTKILINKKTTTINLSFSPQFNNLKYTINNSDGFNEFPVCNNCTSAQLSINLSKGKNEINLIVFNQKEVSQKIDFYSLDYLEIKREITCPGCNVHPDYFFVPTNEKVNITLSVKSSHNIEGELKDYFPNNWIPEDILNTNEFSPTHNQIVWNFSGKEFSRSYELTSPFSFFPRTYEFMSSIQNIEKRSSVRSFWSSYWPRFFYLNKNPNYNSYLVRRLNKKASPKEPAIIKDPNLQLDLIAIYPKEHKNIRTAVRITKNTFFNTKTTYFKIITTLKNKDLDKILIQFKTSLNQTPLVSTKNTKINLNITKQDEDFKYYEFYLYKNTPFEITIN